MRKALAVLVSTVAACVVLPAATAQAELACGTTPEQWVGYFPGFTHWGWTEDTPLDHRITQENGVLAVEQVDAPENAPPPYGTPVLDGNSLTWYTATSSPGGPGFSSVYTTNGVSCANGVVQSFTGTEHWVYSGVLGETLLEAYTDFSATRA